MWSTHINILLNLTTEIVLSPSTCT
uniref:Uncharacterized protein n=1 Tax=Arundo donax TaxID=35708 RepID=A0A0A8ZFT5_ARUDO